MASGWIGLPTSLRRRHGLDGGEKIFIEDTGDTIVLCTLDQVGARTQALGRAVIGEKAEASVDDFQADRARKAKGE